MTPDEAATLLDKMDDRFRLLVLAALHTGARRGELLKVTWRHDLHHSAASFMVQAGVSLATVRAWLGHKSYGMTLRYAALAPDHPRDGAEVMDRLAVNPGKRPVP